MINLLVLRQQIENLKLTHPEIWEDDDHQFLLDALEGQTDLYAFLDVLVSRMAAAAAFSSGLQEHISELAKRVQRFDGQIDALRTLAMKLMDAAGVRKIMLAQATLSIRAGSPKVIVTDESKLPDEFFRIKREPDKKAIRDHLMSGAVRLEGAEMSNAEPVLNVRIK